MYRSTTFSDYTLAGGTYRPGTVTLTQKHSDDTSPFSKTTTYTYNSTTGAVMSQVENYGTSKPLTTSYTYDSWGNLTSQLSTGSGVTPCTTYYTYDQTHRFPVRIYTSPASSVMKYTYDVFGNVLTEQDSINSSINSTVTHTYNAWGQLIRTDMPDGTSTTYTRGWNNNAGKRYFILSQGTATPWVKTWYDNHGREVMTESIGPMNVSVSSTTTYNSKGLAVSHTETSGNLTLTRSYTYDSRGRVVTETAPGNAVITYQYGNRSVTVTENSRTTTTTYDAWGNVKTVTAPVSSISNTYASNGGIKQTVAGGATWTFGYDDRGNRTSMSDPDAGTTTYVYDAFGRETSRTDGRGVVFVTKYDYLCRVTQRKAGTDAINYTYWTSGNGQLSLKSESNGTWTKSYVYDNLRRVTTETMSNGTTTRTKSYQYGTNGLLSQRTVPGGMTYQYTYDTYGNLTGVDFGNGIVEWSLAGYTGKNTVSETVLDGYIDPFVKTTALDGNGMPDYLMTVQDGNYYQYDDLTFSAQTGNLTSRNNYTSYYSQSYNYDNADRLTGIQQDNQTIMSMTYSANGNITSKTGMGSYTYGSTDHPHAVTAVDNTAGILSMYDQYVSYDSWGNASNVWQTDNNDFYVHSIVYGPDQKRVTSETHKTYNTLFKKFYWDDYEEKTVGNDFLQYYYVYGGDGLAALHVVKTGSNNQTATFTYKVITDHLGSIVSLRGNYDWGFVADYDAWGNREVLYPCSFDQYFDRGYTGHEHLLEEMGLINMNGRMYDPNLGRFLSPDNYIQSPGNPQNYNRYSYCLNNPLKYTDPDGEKISWLWGVVAAMGFIPLESMVALATVITADATTASICAAIGGDDIDGISKRVYNSVKISTAMLQSDELDGNEFDQFVKSFFRSGQCLPISVVGYAYSSILNYLSRADVDPFYGATILKTDSKLLMGEGATLGHYINLDKSVYEQEDKGFNSKITPLLVHEYGHFMQARGWGGTSALSGSVYSLFQSALQSQKYQLYKVDDVSETWVERDATSRGINHLKDEINDASIIYLNKNYPQGFFENRMLHNYFIPFSLISGIYNIFNPY